MIILNRVNVIPSKVGGSLGLWLGLGALQASELIVNFTMILVEKIRTRTGLSRT